jgi:hypothetical protein
MFLRDKAVRTAALSEYVGAGWRWVLHHGTFSLMDTASLLTKMADQLSTISNAAAGHL